MNRLWSSPTVVISLLALALFLPFLGSVHLFDWDEINFAECAREMILTGNYSQVTINYEAFWEKPPLFFWMQVLSMKVFGINEFGARFPNVLCGLVTLLVLFRAGRRLYSEKMGWWWVILYAGSFLPHLYFKSGIIDPWFNLFIFLAFYRYFLGYSAFRHEGKNGNTHFALAGIFLGLAVMTKGPVALLIAGLSFSVFWIVQRFGRIITLKGLLILTGTTLLAGSVWFIVEILRGRADVIQDFIVYQVRLFRTQDAGHGGPFYYHFIILLLGCFPASIPAIQAHFLKEKQPGAQKDFRTWMLILLWVVLLLFSIVKTKIVHYSSLCYFPLTFLAAYALYRITEGGGVRWQRWMTISTGIIGVLTGLLLSAIPLLLKYKDRWLENVTIKDRFARANLDADMYWTGFESLIGLFFLVMLVIALRALIRGEIARGVPVLALGVVMTLLGAHALIVPKIEGYSQRAAIEFYESKQHEDCYVETMNFKSYAHLFYTYKKPPQDRRSLDKQWLLTGDIDKPAYFVSKITAKEEISLTYPELKIIGEKNGFVFYLRTPLSEGEK